MKTSARFNQNVSEGNQSLKILLNGPRAYVDYVWDLACALENQLILVNIV